jgi:hypothetical protein
MALLRTQEDFSAVRFKLMSCSSPSKNASSEKE